eukprot:10057413-Ditylum_brightwellii.AAC.1
MERAALACLPSYSEMPNKYVDCQVCVMEEMNMMHDVGGYINGINPLAFAAKANAPNTPNYYQAMNRPDASHFVDAMKEELDMLETLEAWELICIDKVPLLPNGSPQNIIESTWSFKVQHFPDGGVKKRKARLCVRGDQQ